MIPNPQRPRNRSTFEIAIICALQPEADAVEALFDHYWDEDGEPYGKAPGDINAYTTGAIGCHNVVLVYMPGMGKGSAASVASSLRSSFSGIRLALVVGICGGVPFGTGDEEILLGDIVISTGIIQYDFGRRFPDSFIRKDTLEDNLGRPNIEIRAFLAKLKSRRSHKSLEDNTFRYIQYLHQEANFEKAQYPGVAEDRLYEPSYRHKHHELLSCRECELCVKKEDKVCNAALESSCLELKCNENKLVQRQRLLGYINTELPETLKPRVHFGRIASGDIVMKSGEDRDEIAAREKVIAFEMEGSGVWDNFPCVVIKGVCDYADSHKNKKWQGYSAVTAAACMKAFLKDWVPSKETYNVVVQRPWLVPFERNQHFVGREAILEKLERQLILSEYGQRIAIWGLGGNGKTAIALEFAYQTKKRHPHYAIFWVPAISIESFETAYLEIGKRLYIPEINDPTADVKQLVKTMLSQEDSGEWIMIIDNADDISVLFHELPEVSNKSRLIDYIPSSSKGSIIFTTRSRIAAVDQADEAIELTEMDQLEAKRVLAKRLFQKDLLKDDEIISKFLEILTCLPLAIVQAAAYINKHGISISQYISVYQKTEDETIKVLSANFEDRKRYQDTRNPVATTWHISFNQIQRDNSLAADYLSFMACILPENIPESLLLPGESESEQIEALGTLTAYSFITKRQEQEQSYDMHRLVYLATRNWLRTNDQLPAWTKKALIRLTDIIPPGGHERREIWTDYLPHGIHVVKASDEMIDVVNYKIDLLNNIGHCQNSLGQYRESANTHRQVLEWRQEILGNEHPNTLISIHNLASALSDQGRYKEAEMMHREELELREKISGKEHPDMLVSRHDLALALHGQGKYEEAEKTHRDVLELSKKVLGKEHLYTLTTMNNLALVLREQGKYKEAEKIHREELELREKVLGKEHPDMLVSIHNLALVLHNQGKYDEAETMHREVLELREKVSGKEHPHTLSSMNNLALVLRDQGKHGEAETMHREVLALREKVLGKDHPHTLTSMNNLALALSDQGKYEEAEKIHREELELREKVSGKEHPSTLASKNNLTLVLRRQGKHAEAEISQQSINHRKRERGDAAQTNTQQVHMVFADEFLDYFILPHNSGNIPKPEPPPNFEPDWIVDVDGHSAMHWAAAFGDVEIMGILKGYGANFAFRNIRGETPLMRAVLFTNSMDKQTMPTIVSELIDTIDAIDNFQATVLHHTTMTTSSHMRDKCARYYLDIILNKSQETLETVHFQRLLDAQDIHGNTALHIAAKWKARKCIITLIGRGASFDIPNNEGVTAGEVIKVLNQHRESHRLGQEGSQTDSESD